MLARRPVWMDNNRSGLYSSENCCSLRQSFVQGAGKRRFLHPRPAQTFPTGMPGRCHRETGGFVRTGTERYRSSKPDSAPLWFSWPKCLCTFQKSRLNLFGCVGDDILEPGHKSLLAKVPFTHTRCPFRLFPDDFTDVIGNTLNILHERPAAL